jgi:hypothetical protein
MLLPLVASTCATRFMIDFQLGHFSRRFSQELLNRAANAGNLPERLSFCAYALPVLVPNFAFVRAAVRFHGRLFTLALVALWLGGTSGGWYAEY